MPPLVLVMMSMVSNPFHPTILAKSIRDTHIDLPTPPHVLLNYCTHLCACMQYPLPAFQCWIKLYTQYYVKCILLKYKWFEPRSKTSLEKDWLLLVVVTDVHSLSGGYPQGQVKQTWQPNFVIQTTKLDMLLHANNRLTTLNMQAFPWEACDRTRTPPHTPEEPKACDSSHA